jgi:hypothetical protein
MLYASGDINHPVIRRTISRRAHKVAKEEGMKIKHVQGRHRKKLTAANKRWL